MRAASPSARRRSLAVGAVVLAAVALTAWVPTRPSFDAYGWLVWGHMTLHGGLSTDAAPSWKPLPYPFTLVYSLFGDGAAVWLWRVTATAGGLASVALAGRLAWRLSGAAGRGAGAVASRAVAAGLAAAAVLALHDEFPYGYLHYTLSSQTDPLIVGCVLGAAECWLRGARRGAFCLLLAASLGRPEAWPLLLGAGVIVWRAAPRGERALLAGGFALVPLAWFGIPALTAHSWLIAADNANDSGFGPTGNRAVGVLGRFVFQTPWPLELAALGGVAWASWRRAREWLLLAGGAIVWMAVEVAFGLHGWPALGRYMFEPSAVLVVLAAGFVGRLLAAGVPGRHGPATRAAAGLLGAAFLAGFVPFAVTQGRAAAHDLSAQRARTAQIGALARTVAALGGAARVRACGEAISDGLSTQTVLAYTVGENVSAVGYRFPQPGRPRDPVVVFIPRRGGGWRVRALRQRTPACRALASPRG